MGKLEMNWPKDADGDVLRGLQSREFDFSREYLIDFNVDFEEWPPPPQAIALLRRHYPSATVYQGDDEGPGDILVQIYSRVDYDLVVRVQKEISGLMAPFGGVCESWGALH